MIPTFHYNKKLINIKDNYTIFMHFQDRMVFLNRVLFARGFNGNAWKMHTDKWLGNPVETNTTDR